MARPHVVIIGAGFGGLATAKQLADAPVDVTVVDRHNFHTFQPLLYQVATSGLTPGDVAHSVRGTFHGQPNVAFRLATVTGADLDAHTLDVENEAGDVVELPYDQLVVAAGAVTNTFGTPGVAEHGFPLYTLGDAVRLRNHIIERFELTDADHSLRDTGSLTFVVVGGGPTGVETAGALSELIDVVFRRDFQQLDVGHARVVLVEMRDDLLAPFSPSSRAHARQTLIRRGVEVRTGTAVASVDEDRVVLTDGTEIPTHTLVWAAGVQANPVARALGLPVGRSGRVEVGPDLRVVGHPEVWAVGDVAGAPDRGTDLLPQLAPVAIQSGRHVGKQIVGTLTGRPTTPFRYRDKGTMATIGRRAAVAELPGGIRLRGTPAWLAWLGLHLLFLAGFRNRISVFVNWAWNYVTWDRGPRLILRPERADRSDGSRRP